MKKRIVFAVLTFVCAVCAALACAGLAGCKFISGLFHKHEYDENEFDYFYCTKCGETNKGYWETPVEDFVFKPIEDGKGKTAAYSIERIEQYHTTVFIPAEYNGLPVTTLEEKCIPFGLERLILSDNIKEIKARALSCEVQNLGIGNSVEIIDPQAFFTDYSGTGEPHVVGNFGHTKQIYVAAGNKHFKADGNCLVDLNKSLLLLGGDNAEIPDDGSVKEIHFYAFQEHDNLKSITIPASVKKIEPYSFYGCTDLIEAVIGGGTAIGNDAFANCTSLENLTIGNCVETIGNYAFYECTALKNLKLSESLREIGKLAFCGCGLFGINLTFSDSLESLGAGAFMETSIKSVVIPPKITKIENSTFKYSGLGKVEIPDTVEEIGKEAFRDCSAVQTVRLGNGLKKIGARAFYGCRNFNRLTIPDSVTEIGESAFSLCKNITEIKLSKNVSVLNFLGSQTLIKEYTVPEQIAELGEYAFHSFERLETLNIPAGVTKFGKKTFYGCKALTAVNFAGTVAEWNIIDKPAEWAGITGFTVVCTDGRIEV